MNRLFFIIVFLIQIHAFSQSNEYDSLIKVSKELRNTSEFQRAIDNYQYLLKKVDAQSKEAAYLYNVLGLSYRMVGDKEKELKSFYKAVEINKGLKDGGDIWKNYLNLANYFKREDQYEKSIYYIKLASNYIKEDDKTIYPRMISQLGQAYYSMIPVDSSYADSASNAYLIALPKLIENKSFQSLSVTYSNLANYYIDKKQYDNAEKYYLKALHIDDSLHYYDYQVKSLRSLGLIYMKQQQYRKALHYFDSSMSLSHFIKDPEYFTHLYHNLTKVNMALGNVEKASDYFQKYNDLRDSLLDADNSAKLKEMETKYETQLKDLTIKEKEKTIADTVLKKNIFLAFSILLALLILLAIVFFNQKQKYLKKLKNEEIASLKKTQELNELNAMMHGQEEERNRIANDLHDRLGARLSSIKLLFQSNPEFSQKDLNMVNHIDEAIKETREISHNLSTDLLTRFGIVTALKDSLRTLKESGKIDTDLIIYGLKNRWHIDIERNVYFMLLELINNTLKHADAQQLVIQISQVDDEVNIFYEDDGIGFDLENLKGNGLGMRSLHARVNAIAGNIELNTDINKGVQVVITFKVNSDISKSKIDSFA